MSLGVSIRDACVEDLPAIAEKSGLTTAAIQADVERRLRQAGITLGGRPWLQTQDGAVTVLRMVPPLDYGSGHPAPTLVEEIRSRAAEAGALLEPPLRSPEQPPTTRPTLLGI